MPVLVLSGLLLVVVQVQLVLRVYLLQVYLLGLGLRLQLSTQMPVVLLQHP